MFALETSELVTRKVAFSRNEGEDSKKEYVQDLLEKDGPLIYLLIKNCQANLYICGSVSKSLDHARFLTQLAIVAEFLFLYCRLLSTI